MGRKKKVTNAPRKVRGVKKNKKIPQFKHQEDNDGVLSWCFSNADVGGPFPFTFHNRHKCQKSDSSSCKNDTLNRIIETFSNCERLDKREREKQILHRCELQRRYSKSNKRGFTQKAIQRLQEINHDDEDVLWSVRIQGKERVWGYMRNNNKIFYILWWDPEHDVYYVPKKHRELYALLQSKIYRVNSYLLFL